LNANVVIISEGANALLVKKTGLAGDPSPEDFAVAVKEILALPSKDIDNRMNLEEGEGACYSFVGDCIRGVEGGGFLYTNKESLSVGVVARLSSLQRRKISITELFEHFKSQSSLSHFIRGAVLKEYSGHLIPEGGLKMSPKLYGNGILVAGDAAGFLCSNGLTLQGMNYAIASGFAAAEAVKLASQDNDYSEKGLSVYEKVLEKSFVFPSLRTFRNAPGFLSNPRVFSIYPSILCSVFRRIFEAGDHPRQKFFRLLKSELRGRVSFWCFIKDVFKGSRGILW
jgi:electron transfer flavoprotein-quinone oxidoreductase